MIAEKQITAIIAPSRFFIVFLRIFIPVTATIAATADVTAVKAPRVAGAEKKDGRLLTSGGRVLGVTAEASDLKSAIDAAYALTAQVKFDNAYYRKDIGQRALAATTEEA